jgi:hypothetical protein
MWGLLTDYATEGLHRHLKQVECALLECSSDPGVKGSGASGRLRE